MPNRYYPAAFPVQRQTGRDVDGDVAADGGAAVLASAYSSAMAPTAANTTGMEVGFGSVRTHHKIGQAVWQDANLTADPNLWYDLAITAATAGAAAGNLAWNIEYIKS